MPPSPELKKSKIIAAGTSRLGGVGASRADTPDYTSASYQKKLKSWKMMDDIFEGVDAIRRGRDKYLPKSPAEPSDDYERRLKIAGFFNATKRTLQGLVGMVFRKPPKVGDDNPEQFRAHWEDIDLCGTHGDVFSTRLFEKAWLHGIGGIFVDVPAAPPGLTKKQEEERRIRPYWIPIKAEQILSPRTIRVGGATMLSQVTLMFKYCEPEGQFGEKEVTEYRVYRLVVQNEVPTGVTYEIWRNDVKGRPVITGTGVLTNQKEIPLSLCFVGTKESEAEADIPLKDLGYQNIEHYQVQSDHRYSLHKASIPLLVAIGPDENQDIVVGVNQVVKIPILGGDLKYVEHQGTALGQTRQELKDIETRMGVMGLGFLQPESRQAETAQAKELDAAQEDSVLGRAARSMQDCLERAAYFHCQYLGLESGSISVNTDFRNLTLDPATISAYLQLYVQNVWSLDTLWAALAEGNVMPDTFDPEEEKSKVAQGMLEAIKMFGGTTPVPGAQPGKEQVPPAQGGGGSQQGA